MTGQGVLVEPSRSPFSLHIHDCTKVVHEVIFTYMIILNAASATLIAVTSATVCYKALAIGSDLPHDTYTHGSIM